MRVSKFIALCAAGIALAGASSTIIAQEVPNAGRAPTNAPPPKAVPAGPYEVTLYSDPSLPTHTVYRPADLSKFGANNKLPIVAWGNGGCLNGGIIHETFLRKIASHGFFVVSIGPADKGVPQLTRNQANPPKDRRSTTKMMLDGIDWAVAQDTKAGSPTAGKLNTKAIAVMGQSCGGMQAIAASADPRVTTSVIWNSGILEPGAPGARANAPAAANAPPPADDMVFPAVQDDLKKFHAPVAYFIGGPTDIAYSAAESDFKKIERVPLFYANINTGHGGTFNQPNAGWFGEVGVAWLSWQLKGDKDAAKMFDGAKCGLCTESVWTVKKKNMQ